MTTNSQIEFQNNRRLETFVFLENFFNVLRAMRETDQLKFYQLFAEYSERQEKEQAETLLQSNLPRPTSLRRPDPSLVEIKLQPADIGLMKLLVKAVKGALEESRVKAIAHINQNKEQYGETRDFLVDMVNEAHQVDPLVLLKKIDETRKELEQGIQPKAAPVPVGPEFEGDVKEMFTNMLSKEPRKEKIQQAETSPQLQQDRLPDIISYLLASHYYASANNRMHTVPLAKRELYINSTRQAVSKIAPQSACVMTESIRAVISGNRMHTLFQRNDVKMQLNFGSETQHLNLMVR